VYSALSTGLVNAVVTSSESGKNGKLWEVLSHFTKIGYAYTLQAVTINLDYWKSLSKSQQEAMLKAAKEIEKKQWDISRNIDKEDLVILAKHGMKISEASPKLKKQLADVGAKMLKAYLKDASSDIKKIFKEYRK
jgi:TRAP-type C4-dicarboxylate transport system substrate-binding protein